MTNTEFDELKIGDCVYLVAETSDGSEAVFLMKIFDIVKSERLIKAFPTPGNPYRIARYYDKGTTFEAAELFGEAKAAEVCHERKIARRLAKVKIGRKFFRRNMQTFWGHE